MVAFEKDKIRGAIRTDFVLSAEIIVITLGIVAETSLVNQLAVLAGIGLLMTVGVYGLVAGIVKLDDAGIYLERRFGVWLLTAAPRLMRMLAVVWAAAMFLVGGGILVHGLPWVHDLLHPLTHAVADVPAIGVMLEAVAPPVFNLLAGVLSGAVILGVIRFGAFLLRALRS
jgi:predicted DNA repair protein MutK